MKLWNVEKTDCLRTFNGHTNDKNFVGLDTNTPYIACGTCTNTPYIACGTCTNTPYIACGTCTNTPYIACGTRTAL